MGVISGDAACNGSWGNVFVLISTFSLFIFQLFLTFVIVETVRNTKTVNFFDVFKGFLSDIKDVSNIKEEHQTLLAALEVFRLFVSHFCQTASTFISACMCIFAGKSSFSW